MKMRMIYTLVKRLASIATIVILLTIAARSHAQDRLVLSRSRGPITAISEKVVSEAYKRLGIQVRIEKFPAERSIVQANNGKVDGEICRIKGVDATYSNLIMVPVVVNMFEVVVFTKDIKFSVTGWDSLKPYTIGIKIGAKFAEMGTKGMKVEPVASNKQLFLMLDLGRTDLVVASKVTGLYELKQLRIEGIQALVPPLGKKKLYHYVHKKHSSIIPALTKVLQEMEAEGRIEELRQEAITELLK